MTEAPKSPISTKALGTVLALFVVALLGGGLITFYLGAFTSPVIHDSTSPEFHIAYVSLVGPYDEIHDTIEGVEKKLREANIIPEAPFALFLDDVGTTPRAQLRSKVGYIISRYDVAPAGLEAETVPARQVVVATFDGSPVVGSYKSYEAMKEWATFHGYRLQLPAMEIYHANGVTEYQLGLVRD